MPKPQLEIVLREVSDEIGKSLGVIKIPPAPTQKRPLRLGRLDLASRNFIEGPGVTASVSDGIEFGEIGELRTRH